ncbi:uncharacterized protein [Diadema antillarum]|uniref:uncharacterized protein n=1 Tax=Diadema antillarum TaxID=105358 RepID=UPI003A837620
MEEDTAVSGRVLVEPIEFVDLRDIAQGKHGSHRGSPERELHAKTAAKGILAHEDHSYNCLQFAIQGQDPVCGEEKMPSVVYRENPPRPESDLRTPSKDEVLSVVIQKLTELVKNSEKQRKEAPDQSSRPEVKSGQNEARGALQTDRTRLYQCPNCPCLFAVSHSHRKDQLCSCCSKDTVSGLPKRIAKDLDQVHCYRDGKDHRGIACDVCSVKVNSYNDLLYHLATHDANIFRCKFCNFVTTSHAAIEGHQEVHINQRAKKCVCNLCGFKTEDFQTLQTHIKVVHQSVKEILLKCSECGYSTKTEEALRSHMWTHVKSGNGIQLPKQAGSEPSRQKPSSAARPSGEAPIKSLPCKDSKVRSHSPETSDAATKLFKCLLCGYLCEKISTLKAHAWRHAGQEGCSYPVMHKVEDITQMPAQEESEEASAVDEGASKFNFIEVNRNYDGEVANKVPSKSGCHCFPIVLPKEEHEIVSKVFADATSVDTEPSVGSAVSNKAGDVHEAVSVVSAQSPPSVTEKVSHEAKDVDSSDALPKVASCDNNPVKLTESVRESLAATEPPSSTAKSTSPQPIPHEMDSSEDVVEEVVTTDEVSFAEMNLVVDAATEGLTAFQPRSNSGTHNEPKDASVATKKEETVKPKHGKKLKRKMPAQDIEHDGKKSRTKAGISKLLLNAVDDALQVGVGDVQGSNTCHDQDSPSVCSKTLGIAEVGTSPAKPSSDDNYQCPICRHIFPATIKTHVCSQGRTPIFKCHKCPASFWHLGRLQAHMAGHEAILKCSKCPFSCGSEMALRDHVKKAHLPSKSNVCPSCHKDIAEESPKAHEQSCVLECWYGCRECDYVASSLEELQKHGTATHHKPYRCNLCDYSSATPNGIKNHMKFHNADKPYKCHLCDFSGAYPQSLRSHMKKHSASGPGQSSDQYKCKFCLYTSGHLPSMKSHMWRHASNPGYDYDGQDITKMVEKVSGGISNTKVEEDPVTDTAPPAQAHDVKRVGDPPRKRSSGTTPTKKGSEVGRGKASSQPPQSKQIQYGSVIFQCSQCGFKSNDHNRLVEHLRGHLSDGD